MFGVSERPHAVSSNAWTRQARGVPSVGRTTPASHELPSHCALCRQAPQRQQQQTTGSGESLVIRLFGQEVQAPEQGTVAAAQHAANSTVEVLQYVKYFHLVPALGLRAAYDAAAKRGSGAASHFEELLLCAEAGAHHSTHSTGPGRGASGGKAATVAPRTPLIRLLRRPQIMALGLVWESPQVRGSPLPLAEWVTFLALAAAHGHEQQHAELQSRRDVRRFEAGSVAVWASCAVTACACASLECTVLAGRVLTLLWEHSQANWLGSTSPVSSPCLRSLSLLSALPTTGAHGCHCGHHASHRH